MRAVAAGAGAEVVVSVTTVVAGVLAVLLLVYLAFALLQPERFE